MCMYGYSMYLSNFLCEGMMNSSWNSSLNMKAGSSLNSMIRPGAQIRPLGADEATKPRFQPLVLRRNHAPPAFGQTLHSPFDFMRMVVQIESQLGVAAKVCQSP